MHKEDTVYLAEDRTGKNAAEPIKAVTTFPQQSVQESNACWPRN